MRLRVCVLCVCLLLVRLRTCFFPRFALSITSLCLLITCCTSRVTILQVVIMHRCITAHCVDHCACMHVLVYAPASAPSGACLRTNFSVRAALEPNGCAAGARAGAGAARWQIVWEDLMLLFYWVLITIYLILYTPGPLALRTRMHAPAR